LKHKKLKHSMMKLKLKRSITIMNTSVSFSFAYTLSHPIWASTLSFRDAQLGFV
jgi:hypothetical protein